MTALVVWLVATGVHAQEAEDPDTARARALFEEGVGHVDAGRWEEAAESFRAALELRDAPAVRYNLAAALVELDALEEADRLTAGVLVDEQSSPALRQRAATLQQRIRRRTATVTVEVGGEAGDLTILVNGEPVTPSRAVFEIPVRPGSAEVVVTRNGEPIVRRQLEVRGADALSVRAVATPEEVAAAAVAAETEGDTLETGDDDSGSLVTDWRLWAGVGGVVVLAVVLAFAAAG